nr:hypothetical protein [Actinomycetales bacterium]
MNRSFRTAIFAAAAAATLGLAACSTPSEEGTPLPTVQETVAPGTEATTPAGTPTAGTEGQTGQTDAGASDDVAAHEQELLEAIAAAEAAVPGARAFDLDREENGNKYEIDVTDGVTVTELDVVGGVATITDTGDLDSDDRAEFEAATVTIQEAIGIALAENPGVVHEIELDDDDDSVNVRWEFEVRQDGSGVEFWVDAVTGQLGR